MRRATVLPMVGVFPGHAQDMKDVSGSRMQFGEANVSLDWSTATLYRIPPGAHTAHTLVIAVDHLQRCVVWLGSRHWQRIRRRWPFAKRFE
jgi:hypothetical protein